MPTALEDIRARIDRGMGRSTSLPPIPRRRPEFIEGQALEAAGMDFGGQAPYEPEPTLESLKARIQAAKGLTPIPRRRPEVLGITAPEQEPYTPEPPQALYMPEQPQAPYTAERHRALPAVPSMPSSRARPAAWQASRNRSASRRSGGPGGSWSSMDA